jgi:dienelactone hydrolase
MQGGNAMKRYFSIVLILTLVSLGGWTQSLAQTGERSGKFTIYYGDKETGFETYSVSESEGEIKLSDRAEFAVAGQNFLVNLDLWMDNSYWALRLNMDGKAMGTEYQISTEFAEGKAINNISGMKDTTTEVPVHEDALILPNGLFFPYTLLVQRYDFQKGGKQECFGYIVPQMEMTIQAEDKGKDSVSFKATEAELTKIFVSLGGLVGVNLWINDDKDILKLNIPMQGIEVFKEGYEPVPTEVEVDTLKADTLKVDTLEADTLEVNTLKVDTLEADTLKVDTLKETYPSEEITFKSGELTLAGTVTIPQDERKRHPAVIIISGSGAQDRNGKTPELKFSVQYKTLAQELSDSGTLVLRYDERGVGESEGDFSTASLTDLVSDVKAGISYLKTRLDVDTTRICLIGHSEGGIIAPKIASEDTTIKAIVLMAGTAKPLDQVITEQQEYVLKKQNVTQEIRKQMVDEQKDFFAWVRGETEWDEEKVSQLGKLADKKQWFLEHFQHDPLETIKQVKCKVLILQGGKDRQVFEDHAKMLNQALNESGNENHTLKIFPDLDHLFCRTEGEGDYAEYATERPLDQEFLNFLTDWLKKEL